MTIPGPVRAFHTVKFRSVLPDTRTERPPNAIVLTLGDAGQQQLKSDELFVTTLGTSGDLLHRLPPDLPFAFY
jgi:hypothetical protein